MYCFTKAEKERVIMKKLFYYADRYLQKSDWKDMAMLKFCLFPLEFWQG